MTNRKVIKQSCQTHRVDRCTAHGVAEPDFGFSSERSLCEGRSNGFSLLKALNELSSFLNAHGGGSCVFALQFPQRLFPPLALPLPLRPPLFSSPLSSFVLVLLLKRLVALLLPLLFPKLTLPLGKQLFCSLRPFFVFFALLLLLLMQAMKVQAAFALLLLVKMVVQRGSRQRRRRRRLQLLLLLLLLLMVMTTLVVEVELVLLFILS